MEWIKVSDRLPEKYESYLFMMGRHGMPSVGGKDAMRVGIFGEYAGRDVVWLHGKYPISEFTHWMPLPEPPKEEG